MKWYRIESKSRDSAEIHIYDEVGLFGISAKAFVDDLKALGEIRNLAVRINSPGGDVFDGLVIFNVLARHKADVTVTIDGIAASIASVIAMAGNKIIMPENAMMMIHDPSGLVMGNADDMREVADILEKIKMSLVSAYRRSGQSDEKIIEMMSAETWMTAAEAKALGFADDVLPAQDIAARFDLKRYHNVPTRLAAMSSTRPGADPAKPSPANPPAADLEKHRTEILAIIKLCKDAGVPDLGAEFLAKGMTLEAVQDRLKDAPAIHDACTAGGFPNRGGRYIKAGMTLDDVRAEILALKVALDRSDIDNKFVPDVMNNRSTVIDHREIYSRRRKMVGIAVLPPR